MHTNHYPLHQAVKKGKIFKIKPYLKLYNKDPFEKDQHFHTPLFYAMKYNRRLSIRILSKFMLTDILDKQRNKKSIFIYHNLNLSNKTFQYLFKMFQENIVFHPSKYSFIENTIVKKDNLELLKIFIATLSFNLYVIDQMFHLAIKYNKVEILEYLLETFPEHINTNFEFNNTLIHYSTFYNNFAITEQLLQKGATPNTCNNLFQNPLENAFNHKNNKIIDLLIKYRTNSFMLVFKIKETFEHNHHDLISLIIEQSNFENLYECLEYSKINKDHQKYTHLIDDKISNIEDYITSKTNPDMFFKIFSYVADETSLKFFRNNLLNFGKGNSY